MANYQKIDTINATDWLLMRPQGLFEALRMAWMLWKYPDKVAILIGIPAGWIDANAIPQKLLRDMTEDGFKAGARAA